MSAKRQLQKSLNKLRVSNLKRVRVVAPLKVNKIRTVVTFSYSVRRWLNDWLVGVFYGGAKWPI